EVALYQAWNLNRILRDIEVSDNWRYFNTGRTAAKEAFNSHPKLIQNIKEIEEAFAGNRDPD
ncbi:MAG: hypothetical protein VB081_14140, partial [Christensenella sp.]|uniref:hypothetical protein n=1 Tax=Christensenella sp. TaxID=1935934 RepID=UPI002B1F9B31